jgi:hypothetical protein
VDEYESKPESVDTNVDNETSSDSIAILISEVKFVEHQKSKNSMSDVDRWIS